MVDGFMPKQTVITRCPLCRCIDYLAVYQGRRLQQAWLSSYVFRYKDMRGERVDSTVDVVKGLDICYIRPRREVKDLPSKSASADIAPNDACHNWKGRHPFCERDVKTVAVRATPISQCCVRSQRGR